MKSADVLILALKKKESLAVCDTSPLFSSPSQQITELHYTHSVWLTLWARDMGAYQKSIASLIIL